MSRGRAVRPGGEQTAPETEAPTRPALSFACSGEPMGTARAAGGTACLLVDRRTGGWRGGRAVREICDHGVAALWECSSPFPLADTELDSGTGTGRAFAIGGAR